MNAQSQTDRLMDRLLPAIANLENSRIAHKSTRRMVKLDARKVRRLKHQIEVLLDEDRPKVGI